ncbi:hypothetical protein MMYC01_205644 [Madurella mycetomatis]|uniref:Uncharacterized protein n=1 Tax=Madurella mycetomatis TaxID=100816 RepID=A0A175W5I5_9PEZI|nr:hypothetical protein MMYC01_205644 [Madurella mycetomatis]
MITEIRYDTLTKIHLIIERPLSLGSLVTSLRAGGQAPFHTADKYQGRVADLAQRVQAVRVSRFKIPGTVPHLDTRMNCSLTHKEAVENVIHEEAKISSEIFQQLKIRAQKSGAFDEEAFEKLEMAGFKFQPPKLLH